MTIEHYKLPRLYVDVPLSAGTAITLSTDHIHYFKTVLRRQPGDLVRLFNGRDGEWLCALTALDKKTGTATPDRQLRPQPASAPRVHLYFAPIKKASMDWLIEKAVELGATDLHPVLTQNTEIRELNTVRLVQQIMEAAEQCERLDNPRLHDMKKLAALNDDIPMLACIERGDAKPLLAALKERPGQNLSFLIGPAGGFTDDELSQLSARKNWTPVTLGPRVLRCETAVCAALSAAMLQHI